MDSNSFWLWKSLLPKSLPIILKVDLRPPPHMCWCYTWAFERNYICLCLKPKPKHFPWNQGISLRVGKFIFNFAIFCNSLIFLILFQRISFFFIRIIYMPHTFSSNYSFIANYLHEEIKKRKNHISLRVGKFPRFEIFNFPTRREIPYASVQTDC